MRQQTTPLLLNLSRRGFTIVELLVVIVVIGILAAITIVAYNGITRQATDASLKSDLRNAASALEVDKTLSGSYPSNASSSGDGQGLKSSGTNVLTYVLKPYGFCLVASSPSTPKSYILSSATGQISDGTCDAATTTLAGSTYGYADGTGAAAQFRFPRGIAVDASGTAYVVDSENHRIRMISPGGAVTTLAGSTQGYADGSGTAALFNSPRGITVNSSGMVYVVDSGNHRVRTISPGGAVSTLAGSGTRGYVDGTGAAAQFDSPQGITVDASGVLYVTDGSNRVRRISQSGTVSTLAGAGTMGNADGLGTAAQFRQPQGIAVDAFGTLYVVD